MEFESSGLASLAHNQINRPNQGRKDEKKSAHCDGDYSYVYYLPEQIELRDHSWDQQIISAQEGRDKNGKIVLRNMYIIS